MSNGFWSGTDVSTVTSASDVNGNITCTSTTGFFPGAVAYITKTGTTAQLIVVSITDATHLTAVLYSAWFTAGPNYGHSDLSAFNGAGTLTQPKQFISLPPGIMPTRAE